MPYTDQVQNWSVLQAEGTIIFTIPLYPDPPTLLCQQYAMRNEVDSCLITQGVPPLPFVRTK